MPHICHAAWPGHRLASRLSRQLLRAAGVRQGVTSPSGLPDGVSPTPGGLPVVWMPSGSAETGEVPMLGAGKGVPTDLGRPDIKEQATRACWEACEGAGKCSREGQPAVIELGGFRAGRNPFLDPGLQQR